jgi:hypothetical protein
MCKKELKYIYSDFFPRDILSHGLCRACSIEALHEAGLKTELEEALDNLRVLIDDEQLHLVRLRKAFNAIENEIMGIKENK